jgi:predicted phage terminase large subunit-like protein
VDARAERGDKAVRAQSMRGRMALEGLYVPAGSAWLPDFRSELLSFPAGRHDDQMDAIGLVGQLLDTMVRPAPPNE